MAGLDNPWEAVQAFGRPNVDWCEAAVGGWIQEPANTWSNLGYVLAGLVVLAASHDRDDPWVRRFAPALLLLGILSGLYHASVSFVLQVGDFAGMFLVTGLALALNLQRLGALRPRGRARFLVAYLFTSLVLLFVLRHAGPPIQSLVGVQVLGVVATEALLWRRGPAVARRWWLAAFVLLLVGAGFSAADLSRLYCRPEDHFLQGHAIWHVLSAAALLALWRFHRESGLPTVHLTPPG